MMKLKLFITVLILVPFLSFGQDTLNNQNSSGKEIFYSEYKSKINLDSFYILEPHEKPEDFVRRIFRVYPEFKIHHGVFPLKKWIDFEKEYIVGFIEHYPLEQNKLITGLILEPISNTKYKLNIIGEWMEGCPREDMEVRSVFTYKNKLFILVTDGCWQHGLLNDVFIYNKQIGNGKLILEKVLHEHCDYSWIEDETGGDYAYLIELETEEEYLEKVEDIECNLDSYEKIIEVFDEKNSRN